MQHPLKQFIENKRGNFLLTAIVIIITLMCADIAWIVMAVTQSRFLDAFTVYETNAQMQGLDAILRTQSAWVIVVINIGLVALLIVSAWKRQTVEEPIEL